MILVTGANGNVGGELVKQLAGADRPVRALVRGNSRSALPANVELVSGDLDQPESLAACLTGVRGVFLLEGFRDMPGVLAAMHQAHVEHVVLLSSRSVVGGSPSNAVVRMHLLSEAAVRESGVPWTILQPSGFMSNALRWLPQMQAGDVIRAPFGDVPVAAIDPADIASVAAAALTTDGHASRSYVLSGPQALLPADQVAVLARVLDRDLRFDGLSNPEARAELSKSTPPEYVDAFFRFFVDGEFDDSPVVPTVKEITGRRPGTFEQWTRAHLEAFR
jgi:uncharacterized protein YbjT (DUF2867 family)